MIYHREQPAFKTSSEAYQAAIRTVLAHGDETGPRGRKTIEVRNAGFAVENPNAGPIKTLSTKRNKTIAAYTRREFQLYESGTQLASKFAEGASLWSEIANPDGTVNSAYGHLIWYKRSIGDLGWDEDCVERTPWEWCIETLRRDRESRQAILRVSLPEHQWIGNKDQVCTMHAQFLVRDGRLHMSVYMRSCDVVRGLVYDMPWFMSLMPKIIMDAGLEGVSVGEYYHHATSLHLYVEDKAIAKDMIGE